MTYREAAVAVLRRADEPLTIHEITERAVAEGLIASSGKTPESTMSATLYRTPTNGPIRREFEQGPNRARKGTVRWALTDDTG